MDITTFVKLGLKRHWPRAIGAIVAIAALSTMAPSSAETVVAPVPVVAAPNGSPTGDGSIAHPLNLAGALAATSPVRAGGTVLLRGGVYAGPFDSRIAGAPGQPITIRSYPGEWAVLDGVSKSEPALTIYGGDTWFRDFEVTKSDPDRWTEQSGSHPTDLARGSAGSQTVGGSGIYVFAPRIKLINLVIHDAASGVGFWRWNANDGEMYGNIIFNNGWSAPDRGHGHGIYTQNTDGTKTIADNVIFNNFAYGLHAYDEYNKMSGYNISRNVTFGNGSPSGTLSPNIFVGTGQSTTDRISVADNIAYHASHTQGDNVRLGFSSNAYKGTNGTIDLQRNTIVGGINNLVMQGWQNAIVSGNEITTRPKSFGGTNLVKMSTPALPNYQWTGNTYADSDYTSASNWPPCFYLFDAPMNTSKSRWGYSTWRSATGWDAGSVYRNTATSTTKVAVQPNKFETGRATVTILNRSAADNVTVDLRSVGLAVGQRFVVRDVQNLAGDPVYDGIYSGSSITLPTALSAITQPIGGSVSPVVHTPRDFNVFLVVPVRS